MAVRRRVLPRRVYETTPEVRAAALSLELWEAFWGGPDEGRKAWAACRGRLVRRGPHRPEPWWAYEPGILITLRLALAPPDPRPLLGGLPIDGAATEAWRRQQIARYEWLIRSGQLSIDEIEDARARIALIRRTMEP